MKRYFPTSVLFLLLSLLGACKKEEEAEPQTGNLVVGFQYGTSLSDVPYSLYTEQLWASSLFAEPLRSGVVPKLPSGVTSVRANIEINDLNAGNYVFVVGNSNRWSVQVTAGKTTNVFK